MTITNSTGQEIKLPELPSFSIPATDEQCLAFAEWQQRCVEAVAAQGCTAVWVHDELLIMPA